MDRWPHKWRPIMTVNHQIMLLHNFYNLFFFIYHLGMIKQYDLCVKKTL